MRLVRLLLGVLIVGVRVGPIEDGADTSGCRSFQGLQSAVQAGVTSPTTTNEGRERTAVPDQNRQPEGDHQRAERNRQRHDGEPGKDQDDGEDLVEDVGHEGRSMGLAGTL